VNGEAIYGSGPTPFGAECGAFSPTEKDMKGNPVFVTAWDWRCTTKPGRLFIHLFKWPGASFGLAAVQETIRKAYMLADPKQTPLTVAQNGTNVTVSLPTSAPDPMASVLVLETK
jgi:alpha-L-fucosidase